MKNTTQTFPLRRNRLSQSLAGFALTALFAIGATAQVAVGTTGIDATGNAAKRAGLIDNAGGQFEANALLRCNVLKGEDKLACEARVVGYGNPQGSVAGGGVITEVETVVVPKDSTTVRIEPQTPSATILVIPAPQ